MISALTVFFLCYVVGMIVTNGYIGGVRDEMDGILDMAIILFWPVSLVVFVLIRVFKLFDSLGKMLKRMSATK